MQERRALTPTQINRELLRPLRETHLREWVLFLLLGATVLAGVGAFGLMVNRGMTVTGLNRPVMWGFFITNFVFWIGVSHAGIMLSAILRLVKAEWRRPATRAAEVLTVFSLMTAMLMPIVHVGRPWRIFYWAFPYDFARGIWPNVRSPLIWDPSAILTYLTSSTLFIYVALLPDLAVARDHTTGWRHTLYSILSLGFRGSSRQWRLQAVGPILLSALILPVFVSVHSIVSWDFAVNMAVEGWHSTIFAPYFVIGAIHSGVSAVVTIMAILRWMFRWDNYIRPEHFDALARLLIVVSTTWLYFFFLEFLFGLYSLEPQEVALRELVVFQWPWSLLFAIFLLTAYFIPVPLWLVPRFRRNITIMFWTSILVNIGMWLERFLIIIPGLARKQPFTFVWGTYTPSPIEIIIVIATFAMVFLGFLLFSKLFPPIPLYDEREGQILKEEIQIGRAKVPAIIREE